MPTVAVSPLTGAQFFDNNGDPLNGGKLFYYVGGSFTVQKTTYSTAAGTTPNPNPIVLDSSGRPSATAFLVVNEPYNARLTLADGTTVLNSWTNISVSTGGGGTPASPTNSVQYNGAGSFAGTATFSFDSTATQLTLGTSGATGALLFDGTTASITTAGDMRLVPGASSVLRVGATGANSAIIGSTGNTLLVSGDAGLSLSSNSDTTFVLSASSTPKLRITGPSATQYATGLANNDLVNKYYVDTMGGGGATGATGPAGPTGATGPVGATGAGGIAAPGTTTDRAVASWNGASGAALYDNPNVGITSDGKLSVGDVYIYNGTYTGGSKQNIGIGNGALAINTTGQNNIAIGFGSPLAANTTGEYNMALGTGAMNDNLIGSYNVAVGTNVLYSLAGAGGQFNTAIGHEAGVNLYDGSGNTILGAIQGPATMNDTVLLAAGLNKQRLRINENGAWSFTNPYNAESLDYGATGTVLVSAGASAHPNWKPANSKLPSYVELANPIYFDPAVAGKVINKNAGTIEANTGTCTTDDYFMVYNSSTTTNMAINQGTGFTLRQAGTTNTGNRTLAPIGFARVWFVSSTEAVISGDGLT